MALVGIAGYDAGLVERLIPRFARFFKVATILAVIASAGGGVGAAYGMSLTFGPVVGAVVGVAFAAFMLNLVRLVHAGSGYPVHEPIEEIDLWTPTATAAFVLGFFGLLLSQPLVMLVLKPVLHTHGGLIEQVGQCWSRPLYALGLTLMLAVIISAPGWLRLVGADAVRAYERERWIDDRMFVDDAYAEGQDAITRILEEVPGFKPPLQVHYADPPYNTRPLIYGLDPALIVAGGVKFVPAKDAPAPQPPPPPVAPPPQKAPPSSSSSSSPPPVQEPAAHTPQKQVEAAPPPAKVAPRPVELPPPPPATQKMAGGDEDLAASWDDASHDNDTAAPPLAFFDIGRLQVKRAKEHVELVAPFIAQFTGTPEDEVRRTIAASPDDVRMHKVFGDYKKLRSILLKDARFALEHQMAPIISLIVQRPVADVERRLRAAPPEKRLTGVFAPELARRLLNKTVAGTA